MMSETQRLELAEILLREKDGSKLYQALQMFFDVALACRPRQEHEQLILNDCLRSLREVARDMPPQMIGAIEEDPYGATGLVERLVAAGAK